MKLETIKAPNMNRFLSDYLAGSEQIKKFFHHDGQESSVKKRLSYLENHPIRREELSEVIRSFMEPFGISAKAQQHLDELKQDAVVVIGGQQAGVLTGPLYSVHKAISVILMAKAYREATGLPVVPVFWIAGEDHDLDEINHTYTISSGKLRKHTVPVPYLKKSMATDTELDRDEVEGFIDEVFRQYGETAFTEALLTDLKSALSRSSTFTDFFATLINSLFKDQGLLMIDAAYPPLRSYQSNYFEKIIERSEEIAHAVVEKERRMETDGYGRPVGASEDAANLFYVHNGERVLLKRSNGHFTSEAGVYLTKDELLKVARTAPQLLSNNVVTRPIMQEMVFPVLTFVGGPGEIDYWGLLKEAFEVMEMEMPIIAPRLSITLVDRQVGQLLVEEQLTVEDVLNGKVEEKREVFLSEVADVRTESLINETQDLIKKKYQEIKESATANGLLTNPLIEKNEAFHLHQLNYLLNKLEENTLIRHDVQLKRFEKVSNQLLPEGGLQERKYNPYMYINQYGPALIQDLLKLNYHFDGRHHIVYL